MVIKIGFTGNRNGLNNIQKEEIHIILDKYDDIIVSHGDCIGADSDFHKLCIEYRNEHNSNKQKNLIIHIYPPNKSILRGFNKGDILMTEKPYLERNLDIINNSDIIIACPIDKTKEELRSGTWSTIRQAKKLNKDVYIL